jgi:hypothetical protein
LPGETSADVLRKAYGIERDSPFFAVAQKHLLELNPEVAATGGLFLPANTVLRLTPTLLADAAAGRPPAAQVSRAPLLTQGLNAQNRSMMQGLVNLTLADPSFGIASGATVAGGASAVLNNETLRLMRQLMELDAKYIAAGAGKAPADQKQLYRTARQRVITQLQNATGPMQNVLFKGQNIPQALRLKKPSHAVPVNSHVVQHAARLRRLAAISKGGGVVLTGVGLTASCLEIGRTADRHEKNLIFVEGIASTGAGVLVGLTAGAFGLFLVSNPLGWGVAIGLGVLGGYGAWGAGKYARNLYDKNGNRLDLVAATKVDWLCR